MKTIKIPNYRDITIKNVIFDINGTIQFEGIISDSLIKKFDELKQFYNVYLVSSDTRGNLKDIAEKLNVKYIRIDSKKGSDAKAKNDELLKLGKEFTVAIGNGNNDALMLKDAVLGLVIMGKEGTSIKSLLNSDVAFPDPISAINFLLDEKIMIATLRS